MTLVCRDSSGLDIDKGISMDAQEVIAIYNIRETIVSSVFWQIRFRINLHRDHWWQYQKVSSVLTEWIGKWTEDQFQTDIQGKHPKPMNHCKAWTKSNDQSIYMSPYPELKLTSYRYSCQTIQSSLERIDLIFWKW